jgi:hypothetical protein
MSEGKRTDFFEGVLAILSDFSHVILIYKITCNLWSFLIILRVFFSHKVIQINFDMLVIVCVINICICKLQILN